MTTPAPKIEAAIPEDLRELYELAHRHEKFGNAESAVCALIKRLARSESEVRELKEQRSRIIEVESHRTKVLRDGKRWHPVLWPDRPDCLAWREGPEGSQLLMYNNAPGDSIYIATGTPPEGTDVEAALKEMKEKLKCLQNR